MSTESDRDEGRTDGRSRSGRGFGMEFDADTPAYVISVAAELTGLHPQTLRTYDRLGLVRPGRSGGGGRRYSMRDIETLRHVTRLTAVGIGLEGVRRILELEAQVEALHAEVGRLRAQLADAESSLQRTLDQHPYLPAVMPRSSSAVVLWQESRSARRR